MGQGMKSVGGLGEGGGEWKGEKRLLFSRPFIIFPSLCSFALSLRWTDLLDLLHLDGLESCVLFIKQV